MTFNGFDDETNEFIDRLFFIGILSTFVACWAIIWYCIISRTGNTTVVILLGIVGLLSGIMLIKTVPEMESIT
jgi:uncharacterized membrane protein YjjP (DUF1212 family)